MPASLSIIIPTHDGEGLDRCLASIAPQVKPKDKLLVAFDSHDGDEHLDTALEAVRSVADIIREAGGTIEMSIHDAGYHAYGHPQRNAAMMLAYYLGYIVHIDDDDELLPGALDAIRAAIERNPGRPLMFRFMAPFGLVMPQYPRVAEGNVGGTGFVTPNDPARLGRWSDRYQGDYDYITSTLAHYPPDALVWEDTIIARCAVGETRVWFRSATTPADLEAMRVIRNAGREWMTHDTSEITPEQQAAWWAGRDPKHVRAWLALYGHEVLGYGLLTWRQGRWWGSLAVKPEARGKGVGTAIYEFLRDVCPDDVWVRIREDNKPSQAAARKAGFETPIPLHRRVILTHDRPAALEFVARKKVVALV